MAVLLSACGSESTQAPPSSTVASITVGPNDVPLLSMGQEIQLTVVVTTTTGGTLANPAVTWNSSDAAVASVTGSGLVRGLDRYSTYIPPEDVNEFDERIATLRSERR